MRQLLFLSLLLLIVSPAVIAQSRDDLPCASRSAECVRMLSDLALKNSAELRTLDQAIAYQKRRGWSSWLNADGLNPLGVGFRILRNVAGGGDVAANKLDISQLERRRSEVESGLRLAVANGLAELESARQRRQMAAAKLENHLARLKLIEAGYRLGDGSTEEMIAAWALSGELRQQITMANSDTQTAILRLASVVIPARAEAGIAQAKRSTVGDPRAHTGKLQ